MNKLVKTFLREAQLKRMSKTAYPYLHLKVEIRSARLFYIWRLKIKIWNPVKAFLLNLNTKFEHFNRQFNVEYCSTSSTKFSQDRVRDSSLFQSSSTKQSFQSNNFNLNLNNFPAKAQSAQSAQSAFLIIPKIKIAESFQKLLTNWSACHQSRS